MTRRVVQASKVAAPWPAADSAYHAFGVALRSAAKNGRGLAAGSGVASGIELKDVPGVKGPLSASPASPAAAGWLGSKWAGKTGLFQEGPGIATETVSRTGLVDGCAVLMAARVLPAGVVRAWGIAGDCRSTTARAQNIVITSVRGGS